MVAWSRLTIASAQKKRRITCFCFRDICVGRCARFWRSAFFALQARVALEGGALLCPVLVHEYCNVDVESRWYVGSSEKSEERENSFRGVRRERLLFGTYQYVKKVGWSERL